MNSQASPAKRTALILVAASLVLSPLLTVLPGPAHAQDAPGCSQQMKDFPIFIHDIVISKGSADPESVITQDGAVFVEKGDRLNFRIHLMNRIEPTFTVACLPNHDLGSVRVRVSYPLRNLDGFDMGETCDLTQQGSTCSNIREEVQVPEGSSVPDGEHRLRFVAGYGSPFTPLAGAERILVVGQKPDLSPQTLVWTVPESVNDRSTRYGTTELSEFEVAVRNGGTYPNWNPNGGIVFWSRSGFDRPTDTDEAPDQTLTNEQAYTTTAPNLPACLADPTAPAGSDAAAFRRDRQISSSWNTAIDGSTSTNPVTGDTTGPMICSYKRGDRLRMPFAYSVSRKDTGIQVDEGEDLSWAVPSSNWDKPDSVIHGTTMDFTITLFDLIGKAGDYELEVVVDRDADDVGYTPEPTEDDNDIKEEIEVRGVDLQLVKPNIVVAGAGGTGGCGVSPVIGPENGPCPAGSEIILSNLKYRNAGDEDLPSEATNRKWKAAIWLRQGQGEWAIAETSGGKAVVEVPRVHLPGENEQDLWASNVVLPSAASGGVHEIQVRLDHPGNYEGESPPRPLFGPDGIEGTVAETRDSFACPATEGDTNQVWCITLFFNDTTVPEISALDARSDFLLTPDEGEPDIVVLEGRTVTFNATVSDNSLETVEALITLPNGTVVNETMTLENATTQNWTLTKKLVGAVGDHIFRVRAADTFNHSAVSDAGIDFAVREWPKAVDISLLRVNGETDFLNSAPTYQGTAATPKNTWRIEASITQDGRSNAFDRDGKNLTLHHPNGTLMHTLPLDFEVVCDLENAVTGAISQSNVRGEACEADEGEQSPGNPTQVVRNKRPLWFADNTCTSGTDQCAQWKPVKLGWVGEFGMNITVVDAYGRNRSVGPQVPPVLQDKDGPPTVTAPSLSPVAADPGTKVRTSAEVKDALLVKSVALRVTKPDGTTEDLPMRFTTPLDSSTQNGTWTGVFDTGAFKHLDQAGTYATAIVATDFADTETVRKVGQSGEFFRLNDTDTPEIRQLVTVPPEAQEENGPVTWELEVVDSTAVKPPKLTVIRPASGTKTFTMDLDEETGRWTYNLTADPADVGTWTYTVEVEDYSGKLGTATGQIRVERNLAPQAINWKPDTKVGETIWGRAQPTIQVDMVDFGSGVQFDSLKMTVNGAKVNPQTEEIAHGWRLTYTVPSSQTFADGEVVEVGVEAMDNSDPTPLKTSNLKYQFKVDAKPPTAGLEAKPSLSSEGKRVIGAITDLNMTITDAGAGRGPVEVTVQHLAGTQAVTSEVKTFEKNDPLTFRLQDFERAFQGHGDYRIAMKPTDAVGNVLETPVEQFVLYDKSPPKVQVFAQPGQPREVVFANIEDESSVGSAVVKFRPEGGTEDELPLVLQEGAWTATIPPFPRNTTLTFVVEATDFFGNVGSSVPDSFRAGDAVPTINITSPKPGETISGIVDVKWTASDLEVPASKLTVSLYYSRGSEGFQLIPDAQALPNQGSFRLDTSLLPNGEVTLQAIVFDTTNFGDSKVRVIVRNIHQHFGDIEIDGAREVSGNQVLKPGQEAVFSVVVNSPTSRLWANVSRAGGESVLSIPLEASGQGTWKGTFTAPIELGVYEISLAALTPDGPIQTPAAHTFEVQGDETDGKSFVSEWVILSVLFAAALGVGIVGLAQRWN